MIRYFTPQLVLICIALNCRTAVADTSREQLSFDQGWRFHQGDIPFPVIKGQDQSYANAKAGKAWGAAAPEYDDSAWRELDLPHDWAIEGPFDKNENPVQSFRQRGIGWYRRQFKLPASDRGRHLELQFGGVATHCTVWFNGTVVARNWCGYTSFYIDITPMAQYGDNLNTVVVRVDANDMEGWWYEGAGIYRHTWLVKRNALHFITDGVYANPVRDANGSWTLPVEATLENAGRDPVKADVEVTLTDPSGKTIAHTTTSATVNPLDHAVAKLSFPVPSPQLWSVNEPALYQVHTTAASNGKTVDEVSTTCGFRTIRFDADKGFFLNDQPLKLKGVCNHQDHAGVGVAMPDSLWEFRLRKLKEMGVNAYRCSHNPPAKEFLDDCDRLGILVMDENRNFNSTPEYIRQLQWMVRRDRNHPSIILWSVFNEEPMQGSEQGMEMVRRMNAAVKRLDTTRPVTAAQSGGQLNPVNVSQAVDVVGFNYQPESYDRFHAANPALPMTSSEDTSALMTRGEYTSDRKKNILGSYDTEYPGWGATHRVAWKAIATRPFLAGGFVWTGFDYHGEPQPFEWPSASSFFGCMDLCGFPKTAFYLHQALWVEDRPVLQLVPHWNWRGKEGQPIKVMALANCDTVALLLNGQPLGEKPVGKFEMVSWDVPYAPGKLEAVGKKTGSEVSRFAVETTGDPVALRLTPDRDSLAGDGSDALPVTVEALDREGRAVPTANLQVRFDLSGPGKIIGVGNGDPNCHEPERLVTQSSTRTVALDDSWRWKEVQNVRASNLAEVKADFDDSGWQSADAQSSAKLMPENTQAVFRIKFQVSAQDLSSEQISLRFGTIDDDGWLFVNGQPAGQAHDWRKPQKFDVKPFLRAGENAIAVAVVNVGSTGGIGNGIALRLDRKAAPLEWKRSLFNGLAQVIVQSRRGGTGGITLRAQADGLKPAQTTIQAKAVAPPPSVPPP